MATDVSIFIWCLRGALGGLVEKTKRRMTVMMRKAIPLVTKEHRLKRRHLRRQ